MAEITDNCGATIWFMRKVGDESFIRLHHGKPCHQRINPATKATFLEAEKQVSFLGFDRSRATAGLPRICGYSE